MAHLEELPTNEALPGFIHSALTKSMFRSGRPRSSAEEFNDARINFSELALEEKPFAAGGNGQIYRGMYMKDIPIAAKATFQSLMTQSNEELEQEFKILSRLRHPNILRFYGTAVDKVESMFYIVTEYCGAGTLGDFATKENLVWTPARFGEVMGQVFNAVEYMHGVGLVHLDVKPLNVLLAHDGTVRVCDLGGAQTITKDLTKQVGTPFYMPPEALAAEPLNASYDSASWDIYSLSVMLVEHWHRSHPWGHLDTPEVAPLVLSNSRPDFPLPSERGPAFAPPSDLRALVYSMWAQDPAMRPEIGEVRQAFSGVQAHLARLGSSHDSWSSVNWTKSISESGAEEEEAQSANIPAVRFHEEAQDDKGSGGAAEDAAVDDEEEDDDDRYSRATVSQVMVPKDVALLQGWHPDSGTSQERARALKLFWKGPLPDAKDMARWYKDEQTSAGSPWCLLAAPRRWSVEGLNSIRDTETVGPKPSSFTRAAFLSSTSTTVMFESEFYTEKVKLPLKAGVRRTRWLVCAYLSPTQRLVRCVEGFVSPDEEWFPFALATLRVYSLQDGDGGKRDGGLTPSSDDDVNSVATVQTLETFDFGAGVDTPSSKQSHPFRRARVATFDLDSLSRGALRIQLREKPFRVLQELGPGFYNVRVPFMVFGAVDVGNHMSIVRLKNGRFLILSAVDPNGNAVGQRRKGDLRKEIDMLTRGGALIEAVLATHPFHARGFEPFYAVYGGSGLSIRANGQKGLFSSSGGGGGSAAAAPPAQNTSHIKYYGSPRHLRRLPQIPWIGDVSDPAIQNLWMDDGIQMRIPAGTEFVNPEPPEYNHISSLLVYHEQSHCVHNDDCLCFYQSSQGSLSGKALASLSGLKNDVLHFHPSFSLGGLSNPKEFEGWMGQMLADWPMECLCTAHNGRIYRGANARVRRLLEESRDQINEMAAAMPEPATAEAEKSRRLTMAEKRAGAWTPFPARDNDGAQCDCG